MFNRPRENGDKSEAEGHDALVRAPSVSLPKGGGAIRGIGEKFAANPVTGTGSLAIPIFTSPGRSDFAPAFSLSYDSGAGNGPFGFGWSLSLPSITRKTDKGLPKYQDAEDLDDFILSGAEDLVPVLVHEDGNWTPQVVPPHTIGERTYSVRRYRPRIEGLFARIERWTNRIDPADTFWRSVSKDNITTWYGRTNNSRIADPADQARVFSWLICESYDGKGNVIVYQYKEENSEGIDLSQAHERNRSEATRSVNRYLKRVTYGNRTPYFPVIAEHRPATPLPTEWLFEAVLDYGEHHPDTPITIDDGRWPCRRDPFSSYRAGFELRTYRLCQRILMFHHFPDVLGTPDCLVRSTDLTYSYEQTPDDPRNPIFSFLLSVAQVGHKRRADGSYLRRSLPPLEFEYSQPVVHEEIRGVDVESLENLPQGIDNGRYQWIDLDGEGLSGVLTEQAEGWFYKRNLSALNLRRVAGEDSAAPRFAWGEEMAKKPSLAAITGGGQQFLDLAGDGQLDLVDFEGPARGFYERTDEEDWGSFAPFTWLPNLDWASSSLRFVDLTGDGHADILISEDDVFCWYPSLGEAGFGSPERVRKALDEEKGPRLVFADGTDSIYLADVSGDGLTDLVRLRNGEACYWPNIGYGRFGAKVSMDNAPWFDAPDLFDQRRIRLADIDGSGVADIIYLGRDGVRLYFNQSGNAWSQARRLEAFPAVDNLSSVQVADLLGNGTACLVWSSPLPGHAARPMRYIDLMGGQKPHLLVKSANNLGAETHVQYAPSTRFYLIDRLAGQPWITRLPFPVHCVEKVTATDKWRNTRFVTTYSYHHGYFDGIEREFRGFGRVDQVDAESYGEFAAGNPRSPYLTDDHTLYQPPIKTVTWFHAGAWLGGERILSQYEDEYFPRWFEALDPRATNVLGTFRENALPEPDLQPDDLTADELREAIRACKGMPLRQEIYELDADALERGEQRPVKLFSAAYHNAHIRRLQPQQPNRHAVFLVTESEVITYHYELDLRPTTLAPDPRVAHILNLNVDELGNVLQAVTVAYPRIGRSGDVALPAAIEALTARLQAELHLAYTETRYTNDIDEPHVHRLRVPCEVLSCELTGIGTEDESDRTGPDPRDNLYFTLDELRRYRLSPVHQTSGIPVEEIPYHRIPVRTAPQKRLVEHVRMLFFDESLREPLPLGTHGRLGLPYESYRLALTEELLQAVFGDKLTPAISEDLNESRSSGYLSGALLAERFAATATSGQYWMRSGIAGFADDAAAHFYLPERYTDPFGNTTTLAFDPRDLFIRSSTDPVGNTITVTQFDYRVLAPSELQDANGNLSEVTFDVLGLPAATALRGKGRDGDSLDGFDDALTDPDLETRAGFFRGPFDPAEARRLLGNATARHVYDLGEQRGADGTITYGRHPPCAATILRERHVAQLAPGEASALQAAFEYSDGAGNVLVKKIQAEPETEGGPLRWIASGKTVLNNKGKPVKQYEPYFSRTEHRFDAAETEAEVGVTPVMYYDAPGRLIRTEFPDGTLSRVEFSPWHVKSFDQNDTVEQSSWYRDRQPMSAASAEDKRAAALALVHRDTPAVIILDSLGRTVIAVAHNRIQDADGRFSEEKYVTFTKLDAEGKPLWIRDARGNLVMQYIAPPKPTRREDAPDEDVPAGSVPCYDIAGNLLFQHSMDAGDRWVLNDAAGQPFYAWDVNDRVTGDSALVREERLFHATYDALHRPVEQRLKINAGPWLVVERFDYGEGVADAASRNLHGQVFRQYDPSGLTINERFDFKGNLLEATRRLASAFDAPVIDWGDASVTGGLEAEVFTRIAEYDALSRLTRLYNWHRSPDRVAVYEPRYNARGLLQGEDLILRARRSDAAPTGGVRTPAIIGIAYNDKGQRKRIEYGNRSTTTYDYDRKTFRLTRLQTTRSPDGAILQDLQYAYDPVGNIVGVRDDAQQTVYFANAVVEPHCRYEYDALYRLIRAEGREHAQNNVQRDNRDPEPVIGIPFPNSPEALQNYTEAYAYDPVGNIECMRHVRGAVARWTRRYRYADDSNRLLATSVPGDADDVHSARYDYDLHGSMLNLNRTPEGFRLRCDYRDMIHAVNLGGGGHAWYNYDAGKQRTRKRIERLGGTIEERLYLGGMELYRRFSAGGTIAEEIETHHLFAGDQRVLIVEDVLTTDRSELGVRTLHRYQLGNHLGSACAELDDTAAVITYEEYHPYGTSTYRAGRSRIEVNLKRYRYTGMERDEEIGPLYFGARYYAPWLGRWTICDPIGIGDSVNLYVFVRCSPVRFRDHDGRQDNDEINQVVGNLETRARPVGQGLRETVLQLDIDEPIAVSRGGAWDDPANKQFMERLTNQQTKNALIDSSPEVHRPQISLAEASAQGEEAFAAAARDMLTRPFSEVSELEQVTIAARGAMRRRTTGTPRELANRLNFAIRGRIARGATPAAALVNRALRVAGIDPQTLTQLPAPAASTVAEVSVGIAGPGVAASVRANTSTPPRVQAPQAEPTPAISESALEPSPSPRPISTARAPMPQSPGVGASGGLMGALDEVAGGLGSVVGVIGNIGNVELLNNALLCRQPIEVPGRDPSDFEVGTGFQVDLGDDLVGTVRVERNVLFVRRFYLVRTVQYY
jgi:RHS repeat-associated protein